MSHAIATREWWRVQAPAVTVARDATGIAGNPAAFAALVAFTAILLVSPQAWFPAIKSLRIALVAAAAAIAAHLLGRAFGRTEGLPIRKEMVIALLLIGWAALTIPLSIWPGGSLAQLSDHLIKAVIFFWLIGTLVRTESQLKRFAWVLALCSVPLAVTAINNYRSGVFVTLAGSAVQRIAGYVGGSGLAGNPNDLALMLNLLMPITGALMVITRKPALKLLMGGALILSIAAVIVTFSRAGFITLAAIAALTLVAMFRRGAAPAALLLAFLAIAGIAVMPREYSERLATITDIDSDPTGSAQGRWTDWILSVEYIKAHPITGAGLGQDLLALNAARGRETWRSVHNAYLQAAVDLGVPGLALLVAMLTASFLNAWRVRRFAARSGRRDLEMLAQGLSISLAAFTVAAFFHPIAYQFYFFCLAGLAVALVNVQRACVAPAP
jgi:probable O-glycosylation ligase (exosortase A-associated)